MARKGPFKDLGWGKLGGNKKPSPKKSPGVNTTYRTSTLGQMKQAVDAAAVPKKQVGGNYVGIVIRVEKKNPDKTAAAGSSWMNSWYDEILGVPLPETIKCKVRIPALHAAIPEPDKYGCGGEKGPHQFWINMHPTFYASSQDIEEPQCGDVVVVSVNSGDGAGGAGGGAGGGLIMSTVVTRQNNTATPGGACPPAESFPEETDSTASGEQGDAAGGEDVSSLPINPFNLPADCDFECMVEAMSAIMTTPQLCSGRDPFGKLTECGSPYGKKGIFISRQSFGKVGQGMPLPMPALLKALWAGLEYVVIEILEQTADKDYKTNSDLIGMYARFFALGGINVYFSGTPYPGKASKYVEYMTQMAMNFPCKGMVMTPTWGYLSPGNKDKYARQAKYLTDKMMSSATRHMLQLGFSNPWMPSAEYTVATVDGEEGSVSIRYKDSFPYKCFSNVDWAISQILSRSGRSIVTVDEISGEVKLESYRGDQALGQKDFEQVIVDYYKLGFKNIIPAFGVMGTGYEDYRVSSEKPPGRLREEQNFLAAKEYPASVGDLGSNAGFNKAGGLSGKVVRNWNSGYFGLTVPCEDGDDDPRCIEGQTALDKMLAVASDFAALAGAVPEPTFETIEVPAMEWSDGWADYSIDSEGVISYVSPTSGGDVYVYDNNSSNVFPHGCGDCYDAIMALRPASEYIEQAVDAIGGAVSDIWPPVAVDDPPVKGKVAYSVMWWDWLNAEQHVPCWKSTRWDVIRHFHRHSPDAFHHASEGGDGHYFGDKSEFSAGIQAANEAIDLWNRVAATNPSMQAVSIEAFMDAARKMPALLSFDDASSMESYAQAAAHVAQSAATEMGYDAEGSAIGDGSDAASDAMDEYSDPDAYYGSDTEDVDETSSTGDTTETTEEEATAGSGESGGVGLDAYPPFGYIDFNAPVSGGNGGWMPAGTGHFSPSNRDPGTINQVVIHATGGGDPVAGGGTFQEPGGKTSTHYGVNTGGYVFQFVQEKDIAHHCGDVGGPPPPKGSTRARRSSLGGQDKYQANQNSMTVGIEVSGSPKEEASQPGKWYPQVVLENLAMLVANICRRNSIGIDRQSIIGHDEIIIDRSDPGTWLQKEFPEGISYPYAGVDASGVNHGPKGGEMPAGWSHRQVSYSPNINQEPTFPWDQFMELVKKFFDGAGVPMPPSTNFPASTPAAATDGGEVADPAVPAVPAAPCPGGIGAAPGDPAAGMSAAQIAALGDVARTGNWPSGGSPLFSSDKGVRGPPCDGCSSAHGGVDIVSIANPAIPGSVGSSGNPGVIPIYAVANGTITTKRSGMSDSAGYWIGINHDGDQIFSEYMHLNDYANVEVGQRVTAGTLIGTMGTTPGHPRSTGVHLHFGMKGPPAAWGSTTMDPAHALGLQCNEAAKAHSRYGHLCQPGNQNQQPSGPYPGY